MEQSEEWNTPLYINFVDFEKAFDSMDRDSLCKLPSHYVVLDKFVNIIRNSYEGLACRVVNQGQILVLKSGRDVYYPRFSFS